MVGGRRRLFIVNTGRVAVVCIFNIPFPIFAQSQCRKYVRVSYVSRRDAEAAEKISERVSSEN